MNNRKKERYICPPTTYYANPNVCARRITTRRPQGNGKLFTGVLDDDDIDIPNTKKNIDTKTNDEFSDNINKIISSQNPINAEELTREEKIELLKQEYRRLTGEDIENSNTKDNNENKGRQKRI